MSIVRLGDIAYSRKGKKPTNLANKKDSQYFLPYVDIKAFENGKASNYSDGQDVVLCDEGDLLLVWDGSRSGLVGRAIRGSIGSTLARIESDYMTTDYLYYFLHSKFHDLNTRPRGTGTPHVDPTLLWNFEINLPEKNEQEKIVIRIKELLSDIDSSRRNLTVAKKLFSVYRESVIANTFNLEEREFTTISKLGSVTGGLTKNASRMSMVLKKPYLRVANVYSNKLDLNRVDEIGVTENELKRVLLRKGDLLIVEGNGSPEQIGRTAIWDGSIEDCVHQNHIIKVRFEHQDTSKYVMYWLLSIMGRAEIMKVASSTSGLYTLSISKISSLKIPDVDIETQREIVNKIEERISEISNLMNSVSALFVQNDSLKQSVLNKAFLGDLK